MTVAEARSLLGVELGAPSPEDIRRAYVRRAQQVRLATDVDSFMRLRDAFEYLTFGANRLPPGLGEGKEFATEDASRDTAPLERDQDPYLPYRMGRTGLAHPEQVALARDGLGALPDLPEARWTLLSLFQYAARPEAFAILCEGAVRQPEEFLDELLYHFPERVPADVLARAGARAGWGRQLLIADVHAVQRRAPDALHWLASALADVAAPSEPGLLPLVARPLLSLQANGHQEAARSGLAALKQRRQTGSVTPGSNGTPEPIALRIVEELGRLDETFPLELRQVAAQAAKRNNLDNARYEARFATRLLKPRRVREWKKRLQKEAPVVGKILGLQLTEHDLRPRGSPNLRIAVGWGAIAIGGVLYLSWRIHRVMPAAEYSGEAWDAAIDRMWRNFERSNCADPNPANCRFRGRLLLPIEAPVPETTAGDVENSPFREE